MVGLISVLLFILLIRVCSMLFLFFIFCMLVIFVIILSKVWLLFMWLCILYKFVIMVLLFFLIVIFFGRGCFIVGFMVVMVLFVIIIEFSGDRESVWGLKICILFMCMGSLYWCVILFVMFLYCLLFKLVVSLCNVLFCWDKLLGKIVKCGDIMFKKVCWLLSSI